MSFIFFLILVLLIVNGVSVLKLIYRMALFFIVLTFAGIASYIIFSLSGSSEKISHLEASVPVIKVEYHKMGQDNRLNARIIELRNEVRACQNLTKKSVLLKHLQRLERLQIQQEDENDAVKNLQEDREKLREVENLQNSLDKRRKQLDEDAKRLEELQKQIKRSQKIIEKLNEEK